MSARPQLFALRSELEHELTHGILPYWMHRAVDAGRGGFVGAITGDDRPVPDAPKGAILNARILWTFAAASRVLGDPAYRAMADRAVTFMRAHLIDPTHGGVYWTVDAAGAPLDDRKHVYAQAFAIYALAEHYRATADGESRQEAVRLFELIERHAHDAEHGGYEEAFTRNWVRLDDVRLSDEDRDERKSMNTHLHLLEAYTNLYRVWPDALLWKRIEEVLRLFIDHIVSARTGHLGLFFDGDWHGKSSVVSFGHDIEASWLLLEAADVIGDERLRGMVQQVAMRVARAVLDEGLDGSGGIFYERTANGTVDTDKEWWPQAEAIVGFVNAYQETGRGAFLRAAWETWLFTKTHIVDHQHGEWHRRVTRDGVPLSGMEKAGLWKCSYHNARACLEIMSRAGAAGAAERAAG
ncbi:MAG TPA: AGE family epimerase/isomerase [Gemmatimonadaceae bacterium]|nr:AGE family epimerase/isomerase [Gemmatimonadaceae bacterium]